jgi:hypothetical protein
MRLPRCSLSTKLLNNDRFQLSRPGPYSALYERLPNVPAGAAEKQACSVAPRYWAPRWLTPLTLTQNCQIAASVRTVNVNAECFYAAPRAMVVKHNFFCFVLLASIFVASSQLFRSLRLLNRPENHWKIVNLPSSPADHPCMGSSSKAGAPSGAPLDYRTTATAVRPDKGHRYLRRCPRANSRDALALRRKRI